MEKTKLRIGISMRVTDAVGYLEKRDSIAQDWTKYLSTIFPNENWLFIPNVGSSVSEYAKKWNLNAFILSGGENIGTSPNRDVTEFTLLDYAIKNNFPVIGICRGLQLIYTKFGGVVEAQNSDFTNIHRAKKHSILFNGEFKKVNSYHDNKLIEANKPKEFKIIARCSEDQSIEAIIYNNLLGLMWHPEREEQITDWDTIIIKDFLNQ